MTQTKDDNQNMEGGTFEKVLLTMYKYGITKEKVSELPSILSLPILEVFRYARLFLQHTKSPGTEWPNEIYAMIGREDAVGKNDQEEAKDEAKANEEVVVPKVSEHSGFRSQFLSEKFSKDSRYKEVSHFLSSSKEMSLNIKKIANYETLSAEQ